MATYLRLTFKTYSEPLLGLLTSLPFESFEETIDEKMISYIVKDQYDSHVAQLTQHYSKMFNISFEVEEVQDQNWNEVWESNFSPVEINKFCRIRADFHEPQAGFEFEIVVNPKMAFGTGHHETTHMMIQAMSELGFKDKSVLDYGCGTGVLAIMAALLGSEDVVAVDIEQASFESTMENALINNVSQHIEPHKGDINIVELRPFDIILANINRNILLHTAEDIKARCMTGTILLLSGILGQDESMIIEKYQKLRFSHQLTLSRGDWRCIKMIY